MCAQMGALCGRTSADVRQLLFDGRLQCDFECGRLTEEEFHRKFEEAAGAAIDLDGLRHAGSDIFEINATIVPVIAALRRQGLRLVVLSNTSKSHFEFLSRRYDLLDLFDDFVVSYKVGAVKPEAAIFEAALARIGCDASECFYTDDIHAYVEQGRGFGLDAEVFLDTETLRGHLRSRGFDVDGG
jgi:putative hydrolase of the HAD superfamily